MSLPYLSMTGNVVAEIPSGQNATYILALAFFLVSVFLFLSKQSLDAIVIPSGGGTFDSETKMWSQDRDRAEKGLASGGKLKPEGYYVVSGYKGQGMKEIRGQSYSIYNFFREHGIKPKKMIIEGRSHDSEENVLYTLKKLKEIEEKRGIERSWDIAFVSYSKHLKRFKDFYEEAVKQGLVDKDDFRFHEIKTENDEQMGYEDSAFRKLIHEYKLKTMKMRYGAKGGGIKYNEKPDFVINLIRGLANLKKKIRG